jgi:GT2 family glycosyltransferase
MTPTTLATREPVTDTSRPAVTVCIPTRDRPKELARALASISRSSVPVTQVVVSDDGHDAATETVCRDAPVEVDYVHGPRRGIGANRNRAIAAANAEIVAFIDDDGALLPDFLEHAITRMRSAEERHGAGCVIVSGRSLTERGDLIGAHDQTFLGHQAKLYASDEGLRSFSANAVIFPVHVFSEVRFDSQLVYGYDEVDFASRAAAAGYVIVDCPEAVNYHESPPHPRDHQDRHVEASRLHVTLRRYALTERAVLRALAFAFIAPIHMLAADIKRQGLSGVRRTVTTLGLAAAMLWRARSSGVK